MHTTSRPFLERIAALDRAIRDGEYPNAVTFAHHLEVSHRTIQRDIEFLRERLGATRAYDAVRLG
jgi:predicted DNA-binding transcriptional regulator YafY